ncbi:uncharacterized protein LOC112042639 [Lingula anatina]|uniref:Uncharacterized protein LOC112042639 n=1 Tax=Lingula anatina TaxID=7574 RepID=A0A2R2MTA9_LINAN|nr:uncharacterized protein LOC112042639 [Lingula anatina]|eukprot:XP_023933257.1 uncharacterized protein LOC112042639 [Lingula anatina]
MANHNQQYSQKNNIKVLNWPEKPKENLKRDLCRVSKEKVNVDISPTSILGIHRIPGYIGGARPVIAKFVNTEEKQLSSIDKCLKANGTLFYSDADIDADWTHYIYLYVENGVLKVNANLFIQVE